MTLPGSIKEPGKLAFPTHGELAKRRFKMETVQIQIKKTLTKKTKASPIRRILLIDKDKDNVLSTILAEEGYDLVNCDSVQEAWRVVYPHRPHLIILCLHNSTGAGLFDLQECRALAQGVPIILAISTPVKPDLIKAMQHGSLTTLVSSPTPQSVREALHHLEGSTVRR
jgi:DNA-binding NtrC family response regulator